MREGGVREGGVREGGVNEEGVREGGVTEGGVRKIEECMKKGFVVTRREHIQRPDAEWERGKEGMRKERRKVTGESPRFPEVLTLPPLVI